MTAGKYKFFYRLLPMNKNYEYNHIGVLLEVPNIEERARSSVDRAIAF
jgi:hypothetical protein